MATRLPSVPLVLVPPGGIAIRLPSVPLVDVQPFGMATRLPSVPLVLVPPGGIAIRLPYVPLVDVHSPCAGNICEEINKQIRVTNMRSLFI